MDTVNLRSLIASAATDEHTSGELSQLIAGRLHNLHGAIYPRTGNPVQQLLSFVRQYVERLPDILDAMHELARRQNTEEESDSIISQCCELFVHPPGVLRGRLGLNGVMNISYMAYRLIEEGSDQYQLAQGLPLIPIDRTRSNLIVHQLIGEAFANQLDSAVHVLAERLSAGWPLAAHPQPLALHQLSTLLRHWPCLQDNLADELLYLPRSRH